MAESLPLPAEAPSHPDTGALDPTEVIPRPQPVEAGETSEVRVISGEVVGGRHRGHRARPGRGSLGTAVLTATGAVAGLSMLMPHGGSGGDVAQAAQEPASAVPDGAVEDTVVAPPAPGAAAAEARESGTKAVTKAASTSTGTSTDTGTSTGSGIRDAARTDARDGTPSPGRHARINGTWESEDWQEAVARSISAHRSGERGHHGGRHRSGGGSDWNGGYGSGQWDGGGRYGGWSRGD
ncbi:hypothetical protein [Streptomyces sp. NPDC026673]|uniref:hypothetical protein n=1 Tax=Streptomyces sp. NPDC026673 TaxID=3155724 RepID=UPI0033C95356